jgi:hypothetical protein
MSDATILRPERAADCEDVYGIVSYVAPTYIDTPRGRCELINAPGMLTLRLIGTDPRERRAGIVLYSPAIEGEPHGIGMIHTMDAEGARAAAAGLVRMANELDGRKPN